MADLNELGARVLEAVTALVTAAVDAGELEEEEGLRACTLALGIVQGINDASGCAPWEVMRAALEWSKARGAHTRRDDV